MHLLSLFTRMAGKESFISDDFFSSVLSGLNLYITHSVFICHFALCLHTDKHSTNEQSGVA